MFALPSLSSLGSWIPTSLSSRLTHYVIKRALSLCFDLPADWQASNLDTGALVLNDLSLDISVSDELLSAARAKTGLTLCGGQAISQRLPPDLPLVLEHGKVKKLVLSLSQPISWTASTLTVRIEGLELDLALQAASGDTQYHSLSESLFDDFNHEDLAKSMAQTLLHEQDAAGGRADQRQLRESLEEAAHDLPGAFQQSSAQGASIPATSEEQTTMLASVIARLLARVRVELSGLKVTASLPAEPTKDELPALQIQLKEASASVEAVDRSRELSLQGLSIALRLPAEQSQDLRANEKAATSESEGESSLASTEDGSTDDMSMSMAVADLRQSQVMQGQSSSRAEEKMKDIQESVYLSAEEDDEEGSEFGEADEQPWTPGPSVTESGPPRPPEAAPITASPSRLRTSSASASTAHSSGSLLPLDPWRRIFYQGSEAISIHLSFHPEGFAPSSIAVKIGHPVIMVSAQQLDALMLLMGMTSSSSVVPTEEPSTKSALDVALSIKSTSVFFWIEPLGQQEHPPPSAAFWTRSASIQPSTTAGHLALRIRVLHLSLLDQSASIDDLQLSEYLPQLQQSLPIGSFDNSLGTEYRSIRATSGSLESDQQELPHFPSVSVQDWVHLAAQSASSSSSYFGLGTTQAGFPRSWTVPSRAHFRKISASTEGSFATRQDPALHLTWSHEGVCLNTRPLHLQLDLDLFKRLSRLQAYFGAESPSADASSRSRANPEQKSRHPYQDSLASLELVCPLLRLEVRAPSISHQASPLVGPSELRSGILSVDIYALRSTIASTKSCLNFQRACCFFLSAKSQEARMFLQICSLEQNPQLTIARESHTSTHLALVIPAIHACLGKDHVDGLSLFADDLSQIQVSASTLQAENVDRLLGSRYFGSKSIYGQPQQSDESFRSSTEESTSSTEGGSKGAFELAAFIGKVSFQADFPRRGVLESGLRTMFLDAYDLDLFAGAKSDLKSEVYLALACRNASVKEADGDYLLRSTLPSGHDTDPIIRIKVTSTTDHTTFVKESKIDVAAKMVTLQYVPDLRWMQDLQAFIKPPKGVFEAAVPSERTRLKLKLTDISLVLLPGSSQPQRALLTLSEIKYFATFIPEHPSSLTNGTIHGVKLWVVDSEKTESDEDPFDHSSPAAAWASRGYIQLLELADCSLALRIGNGTILPEYDLHLIEPTLRARPCADSLSTLGHVLSSAAAIRLNARPAQSSEPIVEEQTTNAVIGILEHIDEAVFHRAAPLESPLDIISDDVPADPTFLGEEALSGSFATITKDASHQQASPHPVDLTGEDQHVHTLDASAFDVQPDYLTPERHAEELAARAEACVSRIRVSRASLSLQLFDGFDWEGTVQAVQAEARSTRRRLQKIRQYVASGQTALRDEDALGSAEDMDLLARFKAAKSPQDEDVTEPDALLQAIDSEIQAHVDADEWETLPAPSSPRLQSPKTAPAALNQPRSLLKRSTECALDIQLGNLNFDFSTYPASKTTACLLNLTAQSLNIVDNIKTSTWRLFLTELRVQDGGFARPTDSPMLRFQFAQDRGATDRRLVETRMKARTSPLRLHVDQDAVDFLKKFFAYKSTNDGGPPQTKEATPTEEAFIKSAELFPIKIKLDYKPKRVDYRALKEGRTAELMNFFHFEGSEMTLRHITLSGVTGWDRFGSMLQDIWTPDVKANQLADVVSGIAPIRSVVNVGSGLADLVLLPLDQYKRDKRVSRGLQKGFASFSKTTALESLRLGARLATGTQVILEKAEAILGGRLSQNITTEALTDHPVDAITTSPLSRYAAQPETLEEGVRDAYQTMRSNLRSTAQTILAVPMEVYERSGNEGPARAVLRAVPIAVLHPAIGATDALGKALFGLSNQLDPSHELRGDKYKS